MTKPIYLIVGPKESGNVHFGEILHRLRDTARLSRAEAADKIGLSSEYIRLIEMGKRTPALGSVRVILKAYDVDYDIDRNLLTFDNFAVEFTSRIQEARYKHPFESRDAVIGEIMRLLVTADDLKLQHIRKTLRKV